MGINIINPPATGAGPVSVEEGVGLIGAGMPPGVWNLINLGAANANKAIFINVISTSSSVVRIVGARAVGSSLVPVERVRNGTTSFIVQTDAAGNIELYKNANIPNFYHRATFK